MQVDRCKAPVQTIQVDAGVSRYDLQLTKILLAAPYWALTAVGEGHRQTVGTTQQEAVGIHAAFSHIEKRTGTGRS